MLLLLQGPLALALASIAAAEQTVLGADRWAGLRAQLGARLQPGAPFAAACFADTAPADTAAAWTTGAGPNATDACADVRARYLDEFARTAVAGGQIQPQWEGCQRTGAQCLLDWTDSANPAASAAPRACERGSVSPYYIDVQGAADVQAAFAFSRETQIPLVIKNTGHDYKGRSSAPGSLSLWMHNLKDITLTKDFVPEGCPANFEAQDAVTMGAGTQWLDAYAFAEAHNITIPGGSDEAVGAVGGWLQGGGHGALTNTLGLGADRVLQFRVVTPDGVLRVANACQNEDLFFALRGGGGGTFGVVLDATVRVAPRLPLRVVFLQWTNTAPEHAAPLTRELFEILIDNGLKWADEGWGGFVWPNRIIYITPKLDEAAAAASMAPITAFAARLRAAGVPGVRELALGFPSWKTFYDTFATGENAAKVGIPLAIASRLVPRANLASVERREELLDALMAAYAVAPALRLLLAPPSSYPGDGSTAMHPGWRDAVFHVTLVKAWNFDAGAGEAARVYRLVDDAIAHVRRITPAVAYVNEASIYEPDHEETFWGSHYPRLLAIKRKYDPDHLLDCWHCVGWNPASPRFSCYV